ncbi:nitroreductase family protein [Rhodococcus artemisiae]|uniref:nitroreductase family protein n=1 Tax=Rhodococcus artemisiae TaxID=714159 RepID=UPI0038B4AF82
MSMVSKLRSRAKRSTKIKNMHSLYLVTDAYLHDARRFIRSSGLFRSRDLTVLESHIVMDFHRVEKGLTLPSPRPWFGRETVERLLANCAEYAGNSQHDEGILCGALGALDAYRVAFEDEPIDWWNLVEPQFRGLSTSRLTDEKLHSQVVGGTEALVVDKNTGVWNFDVFARNRSSVRNFSSELVSTSDLESAISVAQTTPSVCNRQAARVRAFERGDFTELILQTQNGNRGFGHTASHVLVVTADLDAFVTPGERNQGFIDGGMFAMSLIYALQGGGIASCPLNWSTVRRQDRRLRSLIDLPDNEVIIMLVAIGYPVDGAIVTASPLRDIDRVRLSGRSANHQVSAG